MIAPGLNAVQHTNSIVIAGEGWHHGVAGIVASKLVDKYNKPTILICLEGDKGKGSGRSIPGFDLHEAIISLKDHLNKCGGHEMAIGLEINRDKLDRFKEEFENFVGAHDCARIRSRAQSCAPTTIHKNRYQHNL
ncbi:MAG: DHHA1 domain-containing protein [Oscillospiraceae bacterium]|nr:DHHA1 domain-containing protein [Oscillospiraceae bacterium]